jgi:hypothetical protein
MLFPVEEKGAFGPRRPHDVDWPRELRRSCEHLVHEVLSLAPWAESLTSTPAAWTVEAERQLWTEVVAKLATMVTPSGVLDVIEDVSGRLK